MQAQDVSAADYAALAAGVGTPRAVANFAASPHSLVGHAMAIVVSTSGTPVVSGEKCWDTGFAQPAGEGSLG